MVAHRLHHHAHLLDLDLLHLVLHFAHHIL